MIKQNLLFLLSICERSKLLKWAFLQRKFSTIDWKPTATELKDKSELTASLSHFLLLSLAPMHVSLHQTHSYELSVQLGQDLKAVQKGCESSARTKYIFVFLHTNNTSISLVSQSQRKTLCTTATHCHQSGRVTFLKRWAPLVCTSVEVFYHLSLFHFLSFVLDQAALRNGPHTLDPFTRRQTGCFILVAFAVPCTTNHQLQTEIAQARGFNLPTIASPPHNWAQCF